MPPVDKIGVVDQGNLFYSIGIITAGVVIMPILSCI
jgi:hypothetical protein